MPTIPEIYCLPYYAGCTIQMVAFVLHRQNQQSTHVSIALRVFKCDSNMIPSAEHIQS